MKDQHTKIKGYRDLNQSEIDLMNRVKDLAGEAERMCAHVSEQPGVDGRWCAIGKTDLQKGFMSLVRAIARPESF